MSTVGACAGFGMICGSSIATAATMSQMAGPEMKRHGYSDALISGSVASGGTLGIIIPPSVILIIYAYLTEQSIQQLFFAALIPGLIAVVLYIYKTTAINPGIRAAKNSCCIDCSVK